MTAMFPLAIGTLALPLAIALLFEPACAAAQILGAKPEPAATRAAKPRPSRKRFASSSERAVLSKSSRKKPSAAVGEQDVVLPPFDVELDEDEILPVITQLGLITIVEFPDVPEFVWFSDYDRWRVELDKRQLGIAPGRGSSADVALVDWKRVRETLYVRMKNGFTYKFAIRVAPAEGHSVIRVSQRVVADVEDPAAARAREAERLKREEEARRAEAARVERETALAATRLVPLPEKFARSRDLEARVAAALRVGDRLYVRFELRNRSKKPLDVETSLTPASPDAEWLWAAAPLEPRSSREGILILPATAAATILLRSPSATKAKPLSFPISGGTR